MKLKIVDKKDVPALIDKLIEGYRVFAPVDAEKYARLMEVASGSEACLELQNPKLASKEILLPQTEILLRIRKGKSGLEAEEPSENGKDWILFGVRPCDARSLVLTDQFLASGDHKDKPYMDKRGKTSVVGLACNHPRATCFCTSVGGSPFGKEGVDVLLVDLGDEYLVETLTERGERLIEGVQGLRDASEDEVARAEKMSQEAEKALQSELLIEGLSERLEEMFDDPIWDKVHLKCLGCGVCSYLCPTCWCFDVVDEETSDGVERIRLWDTCQFPLFTLQGSGFNPRPSGKERMRQRIMHKFCYFPKEYGVIACTGCGRCVRECPVNQDIREIIKDIMSV
jgi:sulfhydrogenase subunit beta (sulfur reductase)